MDRDWRTVDCLIICPSAEMLRPLEEMARKETNPDHVITRTVRYGGVGTETYRLGDYFDNIALKRDEANSRLAMTFYARQEVDSHWKDLVMAILRSIGKHFTGVSVEFPRKST